MPCAVSGVCLSRRTQLILFFISLGVCLKAFIRGKAHERPLAARLMLEFLEAMAGNVAAREVDFRRARWERRAQRKARTGDPMRDGRAAMPRGARGVYAAAAATALLLQLLLHTGMQTVVLLGGSSRFRSLLCLRRSTRACMRHP